MDRFDNFSIHGLDSSIVTEDPRTHNANNLLCGHLLKMSQDPKTLKEEMGCALDNMLKKSIPDLTGKNPHSPSVALQLISLQNQIADIQRHGFEFPVLMVDDPEFTELVHDIIDNFERRGSNPNLDEAFHALNTSLSGNGFRVTGITSCNLEHEDGNPKGTRRVSLIVEAIEV